MEAEDLGPGNTETEALESTQNSRLERIFQRNWRDIHKVQSLEQAPERARKKLAGWAEVSTCWTTSFPTRKRVSSSSELSHHASYGTSRDQENQGNG